jgi:hypothetical protein
LCGHELVGELDTGLIEVTVKVRQPKSPQTVRIKDVEVWLNRHGQDTGRDRSQVPPPAYARHEDDPKYACTLCALFQTVVRLTRGGGCRVKRLLRLRRRDARIRHGP